KSKKAHLNITASESLVLKDCSVLLEFYSLKKLMAVSLIHNNFAYNATFPKILLCCKMSFITLFRHFCLSLAGLCLIRCHSELDQINDS
ncbi:hypothetical protein P7M34_26005, partial [Vibrio parahaemolyticus]|nr:hypothetical protein [Vibrio parahaemolyticus]